METSFETKKRNDGYSVKRLREILGVKQEGLAEQLGLSQRTVSKLESKDIIEDEMLDKIAAALNIPVDAIKNFSEEKTVNIIVNTMQDNSSINYQPTFNPVDKLFQVYQEKNELYELLLKSEREKVALLEEVLKKK